VDGQGAAPRRPLLPSLRDPRVGTALLTASLITAGALLCLRLPAAPLITPPAGTSTVAVVVGLALAFFLAELGQALVEVRRQAYSFSLAGLPLLLGLLYCPRAGWSPDGWWPPSRPSPSSGWPAPSSRSTRRPTSSTSR